MGLKAKGLDATLRRWMSQRDTLLVPNINKPQTSLLYLPSQKIYSLKRLGKKIILSYLTN